MKTWITDSLVSFRDLLNGINNTVWGMSLLFLCMYTMLSGHGSVEVIYYFAGVASTLLGIKQPDHPPQTSTTITTPTAEIKNESKNS